MNQHSPAFAPEPTVIDAPSLMADSHASFAELCAEHAVARFGRGDMLLRVADVQDLCTDPRTMWAEGDDAHVQGQPDGAVNWFVHDLLHYRNGDQHRAKRGLLARDFTYSAMRDSRGRICELADGIVAAASARSPR